MFELCIIKIDVSIHRMCLIMTVFKTMQMFNYIYIYTFKSLYIHIHGWNIWNHVFMSLVMHTLCSWNEGSSHMMTRKTKVIKQHNDTCSLEGVTMEKAESIDGTKSRANAFHVPCHASTSWNEGSQATNYAKDWSDDTTQWYIMRLRRSEYDGEGRNQQAVHGTM